MDINFLMEKPRYVLLWQQAIKAIQACLACENFEFTTSLQIGSCKYASNYILIYRDKLNNIIQS